MRITIVFNPKSGKRTAARVVGQVVTSLASHNHDLEVIDCLKQPDFEIELRNRAPSIDRVIVVGGDGTLNAAVNAIAFSENPMLPLAFVPTGRGKDTARTLDSWQQNQLANGHFEMATGEAIDLIKVTLRNGVERYAINIASFGLSATAVRTAKRIPRVLGSLGYVLGAGVALVPPRPFPLSMRVDGTPVTIDNALLLAACNGSAFGGGVYLAPDADASDGLMDIVVIHNANLGDLALQLGKLKAGKLREHPALTRWHSRTIEIEPVSAPYFEADGELLSEQPSMFEIAPKALNWVAP